MKPDTYQPKPVKTEVRELAPEEFWSCSISIGELNEEEFAQRIGELATELSFTYSGYLVSDNYHFSRYPRRAFGPVAPVEKYQEALQKLAEKLKTTGKEEKKSEQPRFRVLLGLQEGYAGKNNQEILEHSITEVQEALGEGFNLVSAKIYSVGPWGKYTEPAIIIEGDKSQLQKVFALAEKFHQARIAVEDLQDGQSHMVETKYCKDPDKE